MTSVHPDALMPSSDVRHSGESEARDSLTTYLREISGYPLLTRAEEVALAYRVRDGEAEALERLVCANLRFVVSIAKRYQNQGVLLPDLISEGNLGLIHAAERFDGANGAKFISYAVWWIRQAIVQALAENGHTVCVPLSRAGTVHRISRHANALRQELGREPTQQELAAGLDISEDEIATTMPIARSYLSLDAPFAVGEDGNLLDYLADDLGLAPDEAVADAGFGASVEKALTRLNHREAGVLRLYFGFDGNEPMTLEGIGARLGVTRERVRQIKEKALSRLRKSDQAIALASFRDR